MASPQLNPESSRAPVVSVAITTHNSEKWLEQALDSVLEQETGFPIEVIIADDCSQDETVDIARSYQKRYPGLITVVARPVNIGIQRNYFDTFERCRGKYIAWLDADDCWTDPRKLAIQLNAFDGGQRMGRSTGIEPLLYLLEDTDSMRYFDRTLFPLLQPCSAPVFTAVCQTGISISH